MHAVLVRAERFHCLRVLGHVDTFGVDLHHAQLIGVHDELLHADRKTSFDPPCSMENEVHASLNRRKE